MSFSTYLIIQHYSHTVTFGPDLKSHQFGFDPTARIMALKVTIR